MATTDIATQELKNPMDVAEYLFRRLHEVGIRAIHGVPGDYNLAALDYLPKCGLDWVGNCNELNAGMTYYIIWMVLDGLSSDNICPFDRLRRGWLCAHKGNQRPSYHVRCWRVVRAQRNRRCIF